MVLRAMPKEDGASLRFGDWGAPKQRRRNRQKVQISVTLYRLKSPDAESFSSLNLRVDELVKKVEIKLANFGAPCASNPENAFV